MFVALGVGAYSSGIFHMTTHAFFKALLFLCAGSVIHGMHGEQDIRKMGGLRKYLPITFFTFFIGVLAISGIPPFAGFFSKDEILAKAFEANPVVWSVALLTSLLTVFYMFRLLFLTFFGTSRADEKTLHHIHESPRSMTLPLMALALLSVAGGLIGVPEALSGSNRIGEFLAPVFEKSKALMAQHELNHSTEYTMMGVVIALTVVMIGIAWLLYLKNHKVPAQEGTRLSPAHQLVYKKYFVDELYDTLVIRPLHWISSALDIFLERLGIDFLVNSFGNSVVEGSKAARLLQSGNIGFYIFAMVIGIILILATVSFIK